jgi:adenosylcobinamide amidohydrolase
MPTGAVPALHLQRAEHGQDGAARPVLVWRCDAPVRAVATTVLGGGLGERTWLLNAEVPLEYHDDPATHMAAIAAQQGLEAGRGIAMVTAAPVLEVASRADGGATCDATVGVSTPTWAAAPDGTWSRWRPGTINLVCWVPAPLSDAALVNALATATEAKAQALFEAGVPGTGTASDAVAVCCPTGGGEPYGGPRSIWGARLARAVHAAVGDGIERHLAALRHPAAGRR